MVLLSRRTSLVSYIVSSFLVVAVATQSTFPSAVAIGKVAPSEATTAPSNLTEGQLHQQPRVNVVDEDPTLDVGPLMQITVARGEKARLPCIPSSYDPKGNKVRLVLWYRNDTTRPFISYDARSGDKNINKKFFDTGFTSPKRHRHLSQEYIDIPQQEIDRVFLEDSGQTLSIVEVVSRDQAEYRCTVHYSNSPSITRRLKLIVVETVQRVQLLDSDGHPVGPHVGPFTEGKRLNITCKAHYSCQLVNIEWQMEGKPTQSKWRLPEDGVALSTLYLNMSRRHALATLTCRLICNTTTRSGAINASLVDASTTIIIYYLPKASLTIKAGALEENTFPEGVNGGYTPSNNSSSSNKKISYRVREGGKVSFTCSIDARPPPYSVSWLHNGRLLLPGKRHSMRQKTTLTVFPVVREDAGLYTCLASNSEGDGQSNAVSLKVHHIPLCKGRKERSWIAVRNEPVTLSCEFASLPEKMNFSWTFDPPLPAPKPTVKYSPKMQRYTPNPQPDDNGDGGRVAVDPKIEYSFDRHNPFVSFLTFTPRMDLQGVSCFARNMVGGTIKPCSFNLKLVDPPSPPKNCKVRLVSATEMKVNCAPSHVHLPTQNSTQNSSPGFSYVLSPEARTSTHLEVWWKNKLLSNMSGPRSDWLVRGLPPEANVTLRVYSASQYAHSSYVQLYATTGRSLKGSSSDSTVLANRTVSSILPNYVDDLTANSSTDNLVILLSSLLSGVAILLLLLFAALFFIRRRSCKRRRESINFLPAELRNGESSASGAAESVAESSEERPLETAAL